MIPEYLRPDRTPPTEMAVMQKLFITGHLLPGTDLTAERIREYLEGLGTVCGMNIFNGPTIKTPDSYDPETFRRLGGRAPEDVNGTVMWDDSGSQIYIFSNKQNWFTVDIYTCKEFETAKALKYTYEKLDAMDDMRFSTQDITRNTPWESYTRADGKTLTPEKSIVPILDNLFYIDRSDQNQIMKAGKTLEEAISQAILEGCGQRVFASYTKEQADLLREIHSAYEVATDEKFMDDVLSEAVKSTSEYPFQETYDRLSQMEAKAAGIHKGKAVVHIGTGWPGTAIGLYNQFGIPVTCIEKDPIVAQKSKDALEKLGLLGKDKLQVVCADGTEINMQDFQSVIISAMIPSGDKVKIIDNMRKLSYGFGPVLILRTPPDRARTLFYQPLSDEILKYWGTEQICESNPSANDPLKSIVCRVKETAEIRRGSDNLIHLTAKRLQPPAEFLVA